MNPWDWPALRGSERASWGTEVPCARGVWGKVHEAATDYRWIGRSPGFGVGLDRPEAELSVGPVERPRRAFGWRVVGRHRFALVTAASRAVDRAARRGFLELEALEIPATPEPWPAAAMALFALDALERAPVSQWGLESESVRLEPEAERALAPPPPLVTDLAVLADAITRGRAELEALAREGDGRRQLAALYDALLAGATRGARGARVARLALDAPLGGVALATLLLPLPTERAESLSLLGWVFAAPVDPGSFAHRWDVVVTPDGRGEPPRSPSEEAERLADLLLTGPSAPRARPAPAASPFEPPPEGSSPWLSALYEFARDPARRWFVPEVQGPWPPADEAARLLASWIEALERNPPPEVHGEQWRTKADQLRSAALALAPGPETEARIGSFASDRIAPDWFAEVFAKRSMTSMT